MLARSFCLLLCVGILHISALPAPQDSEAEVNTEDPSVSLSEPPLEDILSSNENATLIDEGGIGNQTEVEEGTEEPQTNDGESADEPQEDSNSVNPEEDAASEGEEPSDDASDNENENKDNENNDDENGKGDEQPGNISILSSKHVFGRRINVLEQEKGDEKVICQEFVEFGRTVLDKRCFTIDASSKITLLDRIMGVHSLFDTDIYECQEIATNKDGPLVQLCVTHDGWVWDPVVIGDNIVVYSKR